MSKTFVLLEDKPFGEDEKKGRKKMFKRLRKIARKLLVAKGEEKEQLWTKKRSLMSRLEVYNR